MNIKLVIKVCGGYNEGDYYECVIPTQSYTSKDNLEYSILESLNDGVYNFNNYFFNHYEILTIDEWFNKG